MSTQPLIPVLTDALSAVGEAIRRLFEYFIPKVTALSFALRGLMSGPEVVGLERMLLTKNMEPLQARLTSYGIMHWGQQLAEEWICERKVATVAGRLAKAPTDRKTSGLVKKYLLLGSDRPSALLELAATKMGLCLARLTATAQAALGKDKNACRTLREVGLHLASRLPNPRGRPISVASGTAEMVYEILLQHGHNVGYTWSDFIDDFSDPVTLAIRLAVNDPDFDPRRASQRAKSSRQTRL